MARGKVHFQQIFLFLVPGVGKRGRRREQGSLCLILNPQEAGSASCGPRSALADTRRRWHSPPARPRAGESLPAGFNVARALGSAGRSAATSASWLRIWPGAPGRQAGVPEVSRAAQQRDPATSPPWRRAGSHPLPLGTRAQRLPGRPGWRHTCRGGDYAASEAGDRMRAAGRRGRPQRSARLPCPQGEALMAAAS